MIDTYVFGLVTFALMWAVVVIFAIIIRARDLEEECFAGRYFAGTVHCRSGGEDDTGKGEEGRLEKLHDSERLEEDIM